MPRTAGVSTPKYRKHRATGQAVVSIAGRDIYIGPYGSKASRIEYDRLVGEWLASGRQMAAVDAASDLTISELLVRYWRFAEQHYRKDGQPTQEVINIRYALRPVKELYGHTLARDFGPLALKAIQQRFIRDRICRDQINQRIGKIKRVFKWAVSEQLIPPSVFQALQTVVGLQAGRTEAKEMPPVLPVEDSVVEATLPNLPPTVADMVRFQRLTGCRPGEVCSIRPCDVETGADVWVYRPYSHKTQHHGRERRIFIGPQAQDVLRPYLLRDKEQLCFRPADSERRRRQQLHDARKTPLHHGNHPGSNRKRKPRRTSGDHYNKDAYNRAIRRAVDRANLTRLATALEEIGVSADHRREIIRAVRRKPIDCFAACLKEAGGNPVEAQFLPHWHANQLRHSAATKLRAKFGLESARTVLGHSDPKITLTYAEADFAKAAAAMKQVG